MKNTKVKFELHGASVEFNHKAKKGDFYFIMPNGHGFYPNLKEFTSVWGRPFKKNCKDIASSYINSSDCRVKTLKTYSKTNL